MENEEVVENTPVETTETNDEDFFGEIDDEIINEMSEESDSEDESTSEDESENQDSEPSETDEEEETDEEKGEVDFKPLLEELSKKVKYNKESVNVDSIEDLINNYQKGLNYDKVQEKLNNLQSSKAETYVNKKAKELGLSVDEYIDQVEKYEREQERLREQERIEEMIENGVPEDVAKEVIATSQLRKQLQAKENELKEREAAQQKEANKNKEYEEFLEAFPNVKAEDIPKEVYEKAEESSLKEAYSEWKIKELEKQLSIREQNEKNSKSSVGAVNTNNGVADNKKADLFLEGFNEA